MTTQPISTVLGRGALEARALGRIAASLDEAIGDLSHGLSRGPSHGQAARPDRAALQSADLLRQGIEDLATFLEAISEVVPADCQIDPAGPVARLALRDLATRISGAGADDGSVTQERAVAKGAGPPGPGEVSLF